MLVLAIKYVKVCICVFCTKSMLLFVSIREVFVILLLVFCSIETNS